MKKYNDLPSNYYTVDYAELEDNTWKVIEAGDGSVSGLSEGQSPEHYYRACISASRKHKKIINEIAKTNDVELIDATQTIEKDMSEYDLIGFASGYMAESSMSQCLSLHQLILWITKGISYLYIWRQTCL